MAVCYDLGAFVVILLLYSLFSTVSTQQCNISAACANVGDGASYLLGGTCYWASTLATKWPAGCGTQVSRTNPPVGCGRPAVFYSNAVYLDVMTHIQAVGSRFVWLGAQATSGGGLLSDYHWQSPQSNVNGSAVSSANTTVVASKLPATPSAPLCLAVKTDDITQFLSFDCTSGGTLMLCEMSCNNATCDIFTCPPVPSTDPSCPTPNVGCCDLTMNGTVVSTTMTTSTTTPLPTTFSTSLASTSTSSSSAMPSSSMFTSSTALSTSGVSPTSSSSSTVSPSSSLISSSMASSPSTGTSSSILTFSTVPSIASSSTSTSMAIVSSSGSSISGTTVSTSLIPTTSPPATSSSTVSISVTPSTLATSLSQTVPSSSPYASTLSAAATLSTPNANTSAPTTVPPGAAMPFTVASQPQSSSGPNTATSSTAPAPSSTYTLTVSPAPASSSSVAPSVTSLLSTASLSASASSISSSTTLTPITITTSTLTSQSVLSTSSPVSGTSSSGAPSSVTSTPSILTIFPSSSPTSSTSSSSNVSASGTSLVSQAASSQSPSMTSVLTLSSSALSSALPPSSPFITTATTSGPTIPFTGTTSGPPVSASLSSATSSSSSSAISTPTTSGPPTSSTGDPTTAKTSNAPFLTSLSSISPTLVTVTSGAATTVTGASVSATPFLASTAPLVSSGTGSTQLSRLNPVTDSSTLMSSSSSSVVSPIVGLSTTVSSETIPTSYEESTPAHTSSTVGVPTVPTAPLGSTIQGPFSTPAFTSNPTSTSSSQAQSTSAYSTTEQQPLQQATTTTTGFTSALESSSAVSATIAPNALSTFLQSITSLTSLTNIFTVLDSSISALPTEGGTAYAEDLTTAIPSTSNVDPTFQTASSLADDTTAAAQITTAQGPTIQSTSDSLSGTETDTAADLSSAVLLGASTMQLESSATSVASSLLDITKPSKVLRRKTTVSPLSMHLLQYTSALFPDVATSTTIFVPQVVTVAPTSTPSSRVSTSVPNADNGLQASTGAISTTGQISLIEVQPASETATSAFPELTQASEIVAPATPMLSQPMTATPNLAEAVSLAPILNPVVSAIPAISSPIMAALAPPSMPVIPASSLSPTLAVVTEVSAAPSLTNSGTKPAASLAASAASPFVPGTTKSSKVLRRMTTVDPLSSLHQSLSPDVFRIWPFSTQQNVAMTSVPPTVSTDSKASDQSGINSISYSTQSVAKSGIVSSSDLFITTIPEEAISTNNGPPPFGSSIENSSSEYVTPSRGSLRRKTTGTIVPMHLLTAGSYNSPDSGDLFLGNGFSTKASSASGTDRSLETNSTAMAGLGIETGITQPEIAPPVTQTEQISRQIPGTASEAGVSGQAVSAQSLTGPISPLAYPAVDTINPASSLQISVTDKLPQSDLNSASILNSTFSKRKDVDLPTVSYNTLGPQKTPLSTALSELAQTPLSNQAVSDANPADTISELLLTPAVIQPSGVSSVPQAAPPSLSQFGTPDTQNSDAFSKIPGYVDISPVSARFIPSEPSENAYNNPMSTEKLQPSIPAEKFLASIQPSKENPSNSASSPTIAPELSLTPLDTQKANKVPSDFQDYTASTSGASSQNSGNALPDNPSKEPQTDSVLLDYLDSNSQSVGSDYATSTASHDQRSHEIAPALLSTSRPLVNRNKKPSPDKSQHLSPSPSVPPKSQSEPVPPSSRDSRPPSSNSPNTPDSTALLISPAPESQNSQPIDTGTRATNRPLEMEPDSSFTNPSSASTGGGPATDDFSGPQLTRSATPNALTTRPLSPAASQAITEAMVSKSSVSGTNPTASNKLSDPTISATATPSAPATNTEDQCLIYDEWGPYSPCSSSCGPGVMLRQRKRYPIANQSISCGPQTETTPCPEQQLCNPMSELEQRISQALMAVDCTVIMTGLAASVLTFLFLSQRYYLQIMHLNADIGLFLGHLLLALFGLRNDQRFSHDVCKAASLGLQYFFLATSMFQCLEALHIYTVTTDVVIGNGAFIGVKTAVAIGWGVPAIVTAVTGVTAYHRMMSDFSCWVNIGDDVAYATYVPVCSVAVTTIILLEATGLERTRRHSPATTSCRIAHIGLNTVFGAQFASWLISTIALYYQRITLYSIAFKINIFLGIFIYIYHVFSNSKGQGSSPYLCRKRNGFFSHSI